MAANNALIIGPGFVGGLLARRLVELGFRVTALTKSAESAARLTATEPFLTCAADISRPEAFAGLPEHSYSIAFHCASSGRGGAPEYRAVFFEGTRNVLQNLTCGHFVFCSSTSVYGQQDGSTVDEAAPAEPERETGRILLEAERLAYRTEARWPAWPGCTGRVAAFPWTNCLRAPLYLRAMVNVS
jgi:nucleoside-diphosphate-sugar epimerase